MGEYIKDLPCKMTDEERLLKGTALAAAIQEDNDLEDEKKAFAEKLKTRQRLIDERVQTLKHEVKTGLEVRPVPCFESRRYGERMVDLVRRDTHEVVFSRPMRPDEMQESLQMEQPEDPNPRAH